LDESFERAEARKELLMRQARIRQARTRQNETQGVSDV